MIRELQIKHSEWGDGMKAWNDNILLALRIRNLIAAREFNTAEANRELESSGHWQYDHGRRDRELESEIFELLENGGTKQEQEALIDKLEKLTIVCDTLMQIVDMNAVPDTVKEYINKALEVTK